MLKCCSTGDLVNSKTLDCVHVHISGHCCLVVGGGTNSTICNCLLFILGFLIIPYAAVVLVDFATQVEGCLVRVDSICIQIVLINS